MNKNNFLLFTFQLFFILISYIIMMICYEQGFDVLIEQLKIPYFVIIFLYLLSEILEQQEDDE